jgi:ABC-type spermidine/putrescine transport system permease subunit I
MILNRHSAILKAIGPRVTMAVLGASVLMCFLRWLLAALCYTADGKLSAPRTIFFGYTVFLTCRTVGPSFVNKVKLCLNATVDCLVLSLPVSVFSSSLRDSFVTQVRLVPHRTMDFIRFRPKLFYLSTRHLVFSTTSRILVYRGLTRRSRRQN